MTHLYDALSHAKTKAQHEPTHSHIHERLAGTAYIHKSCLLLRTN